MRDPVLYRSVVYYGCTEITIVEKCGNDSQTLVKLRCARTKNNKQWTSEFCSGKTSFLIIITRMSFTIL